MQKFSILLKKSQSLSQQTLWLQLANYEWCAQEETWLSEFIWKSTDISFSYCGAKVKAFLAKMSKSPPESATKIYEKTLPFLCFVKLGFLLLVKKFMVWIITRTAQTKHLHWLTWGDNSLWTNGIHQWGPAFSNMLIWFNRITIVCLRLILWKLCWIWVCHNKLFSSHMLSKYIMP